LPASVSESLAAQLDAGDFGAGGAQRVEFTCPDQHRTIVELVETDDDDLDLPYDERRTRYGVVYRGVKSTLSSSPVDSPMNWTV
jgi:hypothetical protein